MGRGMAGTVRCFDASPGSWGAGTVPGLSHYSPAIGGRDMAGDVQKISAPQAGTLAGTWPGISHWQNVLPPLSPR